MKQLLDARYDPATRSWGFHKAPFAHLLRAFEDWLHPMGYRTERFRSELPGALSKLIPPTNWKRLLVSTASPWVAVFADTPSGPQAALSYIVDTFGCEGLEVTCVDDTYDSQTNEGHLGAVSFNLLSPHKDGLTNSIRSVWVHHSHDQGWTFGQDGTPLPFERLDRYRARRVRDRFTDEMLEEYCLALGIRLFDEDFYGPDCALFVPTK